MSSHDRLSSLGAESDSLRVEAGILRAESERLRVLARQTSGRARMLRRLSQALHQPAVDAP
jgi:hypothetical protein